MNSTAGGIIAVGTRLFFDGGLWEVTELAATAVVLRDALGGLRQAGISHLLADPSTRLLDVPAGQAALSPPAPAGWHRRRRKRCSGWPATCWRS